MGHCLRVRRTAGQGVFKLECAQVAPSAVMAAVDPSSVFITSSMLQWPPSASPRTQVRRHYDLESFRIELYSVVDKIHSEVQACGGAECDYGSFYFTVQEEELLDGSFWRLFIIANSGLVVVLNHWSLCRSPSADYVWHCSDIESVPFTAGGPHRGCAQSSLYVDGHVQFITPCSAIHMKQASLGECPSGRSC